MKKLLTSASWAATSADYSNDSRMQWQGSLNHSRNIYMTGTIGAYVDELFYSEEIVDRNLNGRLTMRMGASCEKVTRRTAEPRA
jgi:hypothetical protein